MSEPADGTIIALINQLLEGSTTEEEDGRAVYQLEQWLPGVTEIAFMGDTRISAQEAIARARQSQRVFNVGTQGSEIVHPHLEKKVGEE